MDSVNALVKVLSHRPLNEMDEPVCMEINSYAIGTKFEIEIHVGKNNTHMGKYEQRWATNDFSLVAVFLYQESPSPDDDDAAVKYLEPHSHLGGASAY